MSLRERWSANFLSLEMGAGFAVTLVIVAWAELMSGASDLDCFLTEHSETLYLVIAPMAAAMLGFILAAAAIIVTAAPAERMTILRESDHYDDLWACFRSAMRFLGFATLVTLLGLAVTGEVGSRIVFYGATALCLVAVLRVARCIWAVNWVIRIFTGRSLSREAD